MNNRANDLHGSTTTLVRGGGGKHVDPEVQTACALPTAPNEAAVSACGSFFRFRFLLTVGDETMSFDVTAIGAIFPFGAGAAVIGATFSRGAAAFEATPPRAPAVFPTTLYGD